MKVYRARYRINFTYRAELLTGAELHTSPPRYTKEEAKEDVPSNGIFLGFEERHIQATEWKRESPPPFHQT